MFDKNKKVINERIVNQSVIHTMQDDLNIDLEDFSTEENNSIKPNITVPKNIPTENKKVVNNEPVEKKVSTQLEENAFSNSNTNPISPIDSTKKSPFLGDTSSNHLSASDRLAKEPSPKSRKNISSTMPKSVDNLTTNVDKTNGRTGNVSKDMFDYLKNGETKLEKSKDDKKSGVFVYAVIIILIILIGVAGYFMWNSKYVDINSIIPKKDNTQSNIFTQEPNIIIKGEEASNFSEKVNFLVVNFSELNKEELDKLFNQKFLEMNSFEGNLLEFIIVNEDNEPIEFSKFTDAFEIKLPANIIDQLDYDFSVYLYKNETIEKMGIAVEANDKDLLMANIKEEEPSLARNIQSMFLGKVDDGELDEKVFNEGVYKNITIRFANINDNNSVDYAIVGEYFLLATDKDSGRAIVDKILLEKSILEENPFVEDIETISDDETKDIFNENIKDEDDDEGETIIEVE